MQNQGVYFLDMETGQEGLKRRMRLRLDQLRWTIREVAEKTRDKEKNVYNWLSGDTTMPGDFVARFVAAVPVNPWWLLTEQGVPEPIDEGEALRRLALIRRISAGELIGDAQATPVIDASSPVRPADPEHAGASGRRPPRSPGETR